MCPDADDVEDIGVGFCGLGMAVTGGLRYNVTENMNLYTLN